MNFSEQTQAVFNADAVLGVHGAGMANILFGHEDLKVLEINRPLDGGGLLRPWFYLLAHARRIRYRFLNSAAGDVTEQRIADALETLERG
jgi:capsular polysaccharide biosynthesis protein